MKPVILKSRGFTLAELLISMALGLVVMGAGTQLFKSGMDATVMVTQQGEMQENVRAALNLIAKDVNMAGSGLPPGGVTLPNGAGATLSSFGCEPGPTCRLNAHNFPNGIVAGTPIFNQLYGIMPGPGNGLEAGFPATKIPASNSVPDSITSIYVDYTFPLNQYIVAFPDNTGTSITVAPPAAPPAGFPTILSPTGIKVGDLILLTTSLQKSAIGEVTGISADGGTISFANGDPLDINQTGAASGNIASIIPAACVGVGCVAPTITASRVWAVSYYVEVPTNGQLPRLMRQVDSHPEVPVADNIIGLQLLYDMCTGTDNQCNIANPLSATYSPNQITKVNIQVMSQSLTSYGNKSQSTALSTSVSTRSLTFKDRYN